jgi:UDP-N-acetylmuramate dehydrogenase
MPLDGHTLLRRLPQNLRGALLPNAPLADQTWFRVGGPAEVLFKPADADDLAAFMAGCPTDVSITVLGVASNTLVRDGGVEGVVIKLGPSFASVKADGTTLLAGAAAIDLNVARAGAAAGIAGLEFLSGIPGTVGGGLRMNAGAYGREFKDIVVEAHAVLRNGMRKTFTPDEIGFSYRHTDAPEDCLFVSALLRGEAGDPATIQTRMQDIQKSRSDSQPIREKTGGSTFANPEGHKSWQLIDEAGCRGLKIGQAQVSEKHCNFLINTGNATAAEIEQLGEEVRRRVLAKSGVELRWEIKRISVIKSP